MFWKEGEKEDREKTREKKGKKKKKKREKKKKKKREKKKREEKNWIYLESISYLNSDWNLFCALFSKQLGYCFTSLSLLPL